MVGFKPSFIHRLQTFLSYTSLMFHLQGGRGSDNWKGKISGAKALGQVHYGIERAPSPKQRKFENSLGTPIPGSDKGFGVTRK